MNATVASTPLTPVLFVSHGSPMFAVDAGRTGPALREWSERAWPQLRPRAVVVMSPHWMGRGLAVMGHPQPPTWHDFGGFPAELYALQYPAAGAPDVARETLQALAAAGLSAALDPERPMDHGAWVPLMHLFPQADVPVVQVSLPMGAGPREVHAIGAALAPLRAQGVLLVGSGSMTHNLREFFTEQPPLQAPPEPYVLAFQAWVVQAVREGAAERLFDYRRQAPHAARAHPTEDHFLPLFFALGAAGWGVGEAADGAGTAAQVLSQEVMYRYLAMDALALG